MSEFKFNQNDEWYTPSYIIEAARKTFRGTINLDPASNSLANETVNANAYYTKECNGLEQPWFGNVWLNPPYSTQLIRQFTDKLINELYEVNLVSAIVLVNAKMETYYCQQLLNHCDAVCFTNHRINS